MKILRSIAAVIVGCIVAVILIIGVEALNGVLHPPPNGMSMSEFMKEMEGHTPLAKEWIRSLPVSAMVMLQVAWGLAAFVGGGVAGLIAGRGRLIHASFIGAFVLLGTIVNFMEMKSKMDYVHPDWLLVTGLLLPLPLSLLGGKAADWWLPSEVAASSSEGTMQPSSPDGAIKEGDPPMRPN
jgi:hypothetical protein